MAYAVAAVGADHKRFVAVGKQCGPRFGKRVDTVEVPRLSVGSGIWASLQSISVGCWY